MNLATVGIATKHLNVVYVSTKSPHPKNNFFTAKRSTAKPPLRLKLLILRLILIHTTIGHRIGGAHIPILTITQPKRSVAAFAIPNMIHVNVCRIHMEGTRVWNYLRSPSNAILVALWFRLLGTGFEPVRGSVRRRSSDVAAWKGCDGE